MGTWSRSAAAHRRPSCSPRSPRTTSTTWVTRPLVFRDGPFDAHRWPPSRWIVEDAVRWDGRRPYSVAGVTGLLVSTPYIRDALDRGVLDRQPMFDRITEDGVVWEPAAGQEGRFGAR